jgi:hypothetical protein
MKVETTSVLSDDDLVAEVKRLLRSEREAIARVVVHLADMDHITFTASAETCALLREVKDRLAHAVPDGSTDQVVNRALKALLAQLDRAQHAAADRPRPPRGTAPRSRTMPAHVRRAVWRRDGGACAFVARSGRRCGERRFLEYHHLDPYVLGGEASADGVELRCRSHNNYEARLWGLGRPDHRERVPARSGPTVKQHGGCDQTG